MPNQMVDQLDHLTRLMKQVDSIREQVGKLPGATRGMEAAKKEARSAGSRLFDAITDFQRAMLNELYRPGALSERAMEAAQAVDKEATAEAKKAVRKR